MGVSEGESGVEGLDFGGSAINDDIHLSKKYTAVKPLLLFGYILVISIFVQFPLGQIVGNDGKLIE